ncbi:hypothetical protein NEOLI_005195 [Neolecta irregularis DAH-3]|uniref:Uncharacterized protein n=1 Tax=Neolecta irregularis (strain DAH-3) TaxID=1198029 RepID=A0A1U7LNG7_NEOID|nr:hypothetical protein NEOLI_005195 [Neolecta irregularis DAH-3]|eukprot:OLL24194.1 hypothetical protein NEOLI_005195 [Neolecta irregularis DAH-3]
MKLSVLLVVLPFAESAHKLYQFWSGHSDGSSSRLSLMKNTNYRDAYWLVEQGPTNDIFYFEGNGLVKFNQGQYSNKMWAHVDRETDTNAYLLFANPKQTDLHMIPADFKTIFITHSGFYLSVNTQTDFQSCFGTVIFTVSDRPDCSSVKIRLVYDSELP